MIVKIESHESTFDPFNCERMSGERYGNLEAHLGFLLQRNLGTSDQREIGQSLQTVVPGLAHHQKRNGKNVEGGSQRQSIPSEGSNKSRESQRKYACNIGLGRGHRSMGLTLFSRSSTGHPPRPLPPPPLHLPRPPSQLR